MLFNLEILHYVTDQQLTPEGSLQVILVFEDGNSYYGIKIIIPAREMGSTMQKAHDHGGDHTDAVTAGPNKYKS